MSEIYISVDIETDGPIPGPNSMLSLGAVAFKADRTQLGTFEINFELLKGASSDPDTMKWWKTQPTDVWDAARADPQDPADAMLRFKKWVNDVANGQSAKPVFVGYPAGFDFLFVYWYLVKFTGDSPFSFSALDIKTYAMAVLGCEYRQVNKRMVGRFKEPGLKHTHVAIDDALEQGYLFLNLKRAHEGQPIDNWHPRDDDSPSGSDE